MAGTPEKIRCTDIDGVGNRKGTDRLSCYVEVVQFWRDGKLSSTNLNLQVCVIRYGLSQGLPLSRATVREVGDGGLLFNDLLRDVIAGCGAVRVLGETTDPTNRGSLQERKAISSSLLWWNPHVVCVCPTSPGEPVENDVFSRTTQQGILVFFYEESIG